MTIAEFSQYDTANFGMTVSGACGKVNFNIRIEFGTVTKFVQRTVHND